jgi:CheY-like chemotaxis protein
MVFLVDDDTDDLEILQSALQENSYKGPVQTLRNGQILIDRLRDSDSPRVVILDLNMPLMDGFQALAEMKSIDTAKNIPVIILTASSRKEDKLRCMELGCNHFFVKPNTMKGYEGLVQLVKQFIAA